MTKARDLANASTALSAVSATELGYLDGVTSAVQTQIDAKLASSTAATTYVANSLADAKGDIFVASADNTVTRLPVGANGDTIVADSSTATGLSYQANWAAGKNKIINGDFRINQRNFTTASTDGVYTFDRWLTSLGSSGGACTFTPQIFTPGAAPVAGYEGTNFYQLVTASQSGASDWAAIYQKIEDVRTFAGQTVTVSFWAKASSGTPNIGVTFGQQFGTGGSSAVINSPSVKPITTSWARYSFTVNIASITGKTIGTNSHLQTYIFVSDGSTLSGLGYAATGLQNGTFQIWGVQVEAGSVATAFQTATGTIQGELAACQRYLPALIGDKNPAVGMSYTGGGAFTYKLPTTARVAPTGITVSSASHFTFVNAGFGTSTPSAITFASAGTDYIRIDAAATGATSGQAALLQGNTASALILMTGCEL